MIYTLLLLLLCCIITIIILVIRLNKRTDVLKRVIIEKHDIEVLRKNEIKEYFKEEWEKEEKELEHKLELHKIKIESQGKEVSNSYNKKKNYLQAELDKLNGILEEKEKRYNEVNQDLELYKKGKTEEIDKTTAEYEKRKRAESDENLKQYYQDWLTKYDEELVEINKKREEKLKELSEINNQLEEERSRRAAINEEILRQRKVEEQQDFYKIQFNEEDKNDVEVLRSIAPRLKHPEAINKVIWSAYYQKPLAELRKRAAVESSGVYKITRIKTGEIYIGQAVNVSTRWAEHCKAALGVGTLASSQLHRAMQSDGCENFLFEVLEETPKEKLRERESYYIDFYDSKNYGLNSITGEKNK